MLIGVNYFKNDFTNLFGYDNNFKTINIDKVSTNGLELYLTARLNNSIDIKANYTYTNIENKTSTASNENLSAIIRRPKNKAALELNYNFLNRADVSFNLNYTGKSYDLDFSSYPVNKVELTDYTLISISSLYRFTSFLQMYGIIKNITDKKYEEVYGYGSTGRTGYLGFKLNF